MNATEQDAQEELTQAEVIIAATPRLPEVESFAVKLYEDWTGDPSLYITFRIRRDAVYDESFFRRFHAYSNQVTRNVLDSGITRFPYTRLESQAEPA